MMAESIEEDLNPLTNSNEDSKVVVESIDKQENEEGETKGSSQKDATSWLNPSSIVLAKVKGYPPWPAMVLDESILPENIINRKPKSIKGSKKKQKKTVTLVPVRFFSDDTYIWILSNDIKKLTDDTIENYLSKERRRKDALLDRAYHLAKNPPDMKDFVQWGSKGQPKTTTPKEEYDEDEEFEIDEEISDRSSNADEDDEQQEEEYEEPSRKKQKVINKKSKQTSKNKKAKDSSKNSNSKAKRSKEKPIEEEYDSDWGLDEINGTNFQTGNYIFDDEKAQSEFDEDFPTADHLLSETNKYHKQFDALDFDLSYELLSDDLNQSSIIQNITQLKKLSLPKSIFTRSKVFKTFVITARKRSDEFPYPKIKAEITSILSSWVDLTVHENAEQMEESVVSGQESFSGDIPTDSKPSNGDVQFSA